MKTILLFSDYLITIVSDISTVVAFTIFVSLALYSFFPRVFYRVLDKLVDLYLYYLVMETVEINGIIVKVKPKKELDAYPFISDDSLTLNFGSINLVHNYCDANILEIDGSDFNCRFYEGSEYYEKVLTTSTPFFFSLRYKKYKWKKRKTEFV